jgi:hypothetical protein
MGILVAALVAVWGLAVPVGLPPVVFDPCGPTVGVAQAGDPDNYVGNGASPPPGEPADSTGSGSTVPPGSGSNDGGRNEHLVQKGLTLYAELLFRSMIGSLF